MTRNKDRRKRIEGHRRVLEEHHRKIERELEKPNPNFLLIAKWRKDVAVFESEIAKRIRKLPEGRKGK